MSTVQFVTLLFLAILVFWAVGAFNRLQRLRLAIVEAQPQVEALLTQRHEWVARMADALQPYLSDEASSFERVRAACAQAGAALSLVQARPATAGPISSLSLAESVLDDAVYPLLLRHEAHEQVQLWTQDWIASQTQLATAKQRFNEAARQYNQAAKQFPTLLIAVIGGFRPAKLMRPPRHTTEPAPVGVQY